MSRRTFVLVHAEARRRAIQAVQEAAEGYAVTIGEPTRTLAENSLLHALISEIAATKEWAGAKRDVEVWKRLLVAAWCRVDGSAVEILPALDGAGVDIVPRRTSKLSKKECADLIEYVYAWGAENGVMWASQLEG